MSCSRTLVRVTNPVTAGGWRKSLAAIHRSAIHLARIAGKQLCKVMLSLWHVSVSATASKAIVTASGHVVVMTSKAVVTASGHVVVMTIKPVVTASGHVVVIAGSA